MRGLSGKRVIVTGGGSGIGRAVCERFGEEGAEVAVFDMNEEGAQETVQHILDAGGKAKAFKVDITDRAQVDKAVAEFEAGGPVDILVNNAGFSRDKYMTRMVEEDWDIVHSVVLKGAFHCCRAVLPGMMERNWGRIVNMSSMARLGNKGQTNYSSAKAGLIGMTNALAREAGAFNITVNAIAPSLVSTPRLRARPDYDKLEARSKSLTALPRLADETDVARIVVFFASSLADFITAQCIDVSGGR